MTLLTYQQAADQLSVSKRTVRRLVAERTLPVVEVLGERRSRRIRQVDLDAFVAGLRTVDLCGGPVARPVLRARPVSSFRREWVSS